MDPTVPTTTDTRETIAANLLNPGDWLVFDEGHDGYEIDLRKVLSTYPYADGDERVMLVAESATGVPISWHLFAEAKVPLASDAEVEKARDVDKRANFITSLHDLALWLDENPAVPVPYFMPQCDLHGETAVARLRELGETFGVEVEERLDDRKSIRIGPDGGTKVHVIAWLPKPEVDPSGLDYSREADDPTPVSPAVPAYVQGEPEGHQPGRKLTPAPIGKHYDTSVGLDVDCACGAVFNEVTLTEAKAKLVEHIAALDGCE